jgi:hypothetical protein
VVIEERFVEQVTVEPTDALGADRLDEVVV